MRSLLFIGFIFILISSFGQDETPHASFEVTHSSLGKISNAGTLISLFTFKNTGNSTLYILRTDQSKSIKVVKPQRGIEPNDTGSLIIYYQPDKKGKFNEKIMVHTNASLKPASLTISGDIQSLRDAPEECYSFSMDHTVQNKKPLCEGSVINADTKLPIAVSKVYVYSSNQLVARTNTLNGDFSMALNLGLYDFYATAEGYDTAYKYETYFNKNTGRLIFELNQRKKFIDTSVYARNTKKQPEPPKEKPADTSTRVVYKPELLSYQDYKANNIVFLIDISNSMQSKDRLPLLKISIKKMISQLRDIDRITIITYSDKARILVPTSPADAKEELYRSIDTLKAGGGTAGSKGLDLAYLLATSSFIPDANNQIILATDGSFTLKKQDEKTIKKYAKNKTKRITLTTVGFGTARTDLKNLEDLSKLGQGNYIYINNVAVAESAILDEIKSNSKR